MVGAVNPLKTIKNALSAIDKATVFTGGALLKCAAGCTKIAALVGLAGGVAVAGSAAAGATTLGAAATTFGTSFMFALKGASLAAIGPVGATAFGVPTSTVAPVALGVGAGLLMVRGAKNFLDSMGV